MISTSCVLIDQSIPASCAVWSWFGQHCRYEDGLRTWTAELLLWFASDDAVREDSDADLQVSSRAADWSDRAE